MIYLLYSHTQMAYHRCSLEEMIEENIEQLENKRGIPDWIVVGQADSSEEADIEFSVIKEILGRP